MSYLLSVREAAEFDIADAYEHYESCRDGLGHDFILCLEEGFSKIERHPLHYKKIYKNLRRVAISRFPYRILYFTLNQNVIVTAVFHARKDSKAWHTRT